MVRSSLIDTASVLMPCTVTYRDVLIIRSIFPNLEWLALVQDDRVTKHTRGVPRLKTARILRMARETDLAVVPVRIKSKDVGRLCGRHETMLVSSERSVDPLPEQGIWIMKQLPEKVSLEFPVADSP